MGKYLEIVLSFRSSIQQHADARDRLDPPALEFVFQFIAQVLAAELNSVCVTRKGNRMSRNP